MTNVEAIKAKLLAKRYWFGDAPDARRLINPDGPEAVAKIKALVAENERFRKAVHVAIDFLRTAPLESGYCCCGDAVEAHSIGSGHAPVDDLAYYAAGIEEQLSAALKDAARD